MWLCIFIIFNVYFCIGFIYFKRNVLSNICYFVSTLFQESERALLYISICHARSCVTVFFLCLRVSSSKSLKLVAYCFIKCYLAYNIEILKRKPSVFLEQT